MLLKFLPEQPNLPFMRYRKPMMAISLLLSIGAIIATLIGGLNLGIDFLGGSLLEVRAKQADISTFRERLSGLDVGEVGLQEFGSTQDILIRIQRQQGDGEAQNQAIAKVREVIDPLVEEYRRVEFVGPTIGGELREAAILATFAALLAVMLYVWFRFEWQFSVAAVVTLFHDVLLTLGLFALVGLEFNLAIVAALLTIAGYSINDTVVIFDRVRENIRKYKKLSWVDLLNKSVNDTLSRTLLTSLTTEIALLALVLFGGEVLRGFSIALMFGVFIGTYSSYFIATPLLILLKPDRRSGEDETA